MTRILANAMRNGFNTLKNSAARNKDAAGNNAGPHSPLFRTRHFSEEARFKIFYDKPVIGGRLPKYMVFFAFT